ncbi:MAG TPA: hypothetical protein VGV14_00625, partial [Rhodanobacter sp.]|nr:hypothetical protein [Rhodanobacter sp.]
MTKPAYGQLLRHSPLESARFGLQVYRGHVASADIAQLWDFIVPHKVDVAIFRTPAENIAAMQAYRGPREQLIHADTLVYYDCAVDRLDIREPGNRGVSYRSATPLDGPALERAVRATFATYQNHYHANPAFSPTSILAGYEEWAVNHLQHGSTTPSWVATDGDVIVGFICCRLDEQDHTA